MKTALPRSPDGLLRSGKALWRDTVAAYELARHELTLLEAACRTADLLDSLQAVINRDGPVLDWGQGVRVSPAVTEVRQQRLVLARLIASLGIPAEADDQQAAGRGAARGTYKMRAVK